MSTLPNANLILARKIADALFTNGDGKIADRLAMKRSFKAAINESKEEIDIGGWCKQAVIDQIVKVLENEND